MSRPGAWAIVGIAALDVRARADHRSELTSQLLLGEVVRRLRADRAGQWAEVQNLSDGYRGWVRTWGLVPAAAAAAAQWRRRARGRIAALFVEARSRPGSGWLVTPLFWQSRVIAGRRKGAFRAVRLPDGRSAWVPARAVRTGSKPGPLGKRVRDLLGVPYLWGGRTPAGMDCSSFVQLLLGEQGIELPRDTAQQIVALSRLDGGVEGRPGDLIFFRSRAGVVGHVGVGLGKGCFAHCRGVVRISSTITSNPLCDKELSGTELGWFRPRPGGRGPRAG